MSSQSPLKGSSLRVPGGSLDREIDTSETTRSTANSSGNAIIHFAGRLISLFSGEYLLLWRRYPNGGTIVFLRSLHVALVLFVGALLLMNFLDPKAERSFSLYEMRVQVLEHLTWFGAIFAAVYALLYARFSSQWTYLAGVYNQIKAAQVRDKPAPEALAEWKAGFIEDCDDLHLIRKDMFASIVHEWLTSESDHGPGVRENFDRYTPGGKTRREKIQSEVAAVVARRRGGYEPSKLRVVQPTDEDSSLS